MLQFSQTERQANFEQILLHLIFLTWALPHKHVNKKESTIISLSSQVATEFSEDAVVVSKWVIECKEDDDRGRMRKERALDEVVKNESSTGF